MPGEFLRIGITCYPSVGGSGILATALGVALAERGHDVHFISYERPFRLPENHARLHFHQVQINDYGLFRYPDYTLPLSVKMAEVTTTCALDVLHTHYAVPHATAALLARSMLGPDATPLIVTTLHGTDTTLLGNDPAYRPAIRHALERSDLITAVSSFLARETQQVLGMSCPIEVVPNFFQPRAPRRSPAAVRASLGIAPDELVLLHSSNLRPLKRVDLLLEALSSTRRPCRLVILAGESFEPYAPRVEQLNLSSRVTVVERVTHIEDYVQIADLAVVTSDTESFCLAILEAMCFSVPTLATRVGGIPEVIADGETGVLVAPNDAGAFARALDELLAAPPRLREMGRAAAARATRLFSADVIVPRYEALYRRICARPCGA